MNDEDMHGTLKLAINDVLSSGNCACIQIRSERGVHIFRLGECTPLCARFHQCVMYDEKEKIPEPQSPVGFNLNEVS